MMKRFCLILVLLMLPSQALAGAVIEFDRMRYTFDGTVKQGEQLEHEFKFTNTGDEDLLIKGFKPS